MSDCPLKQKQADAISEQSALEYSHLIGSWRAIHSYFARGGIRNKVFTRQSKDRTKTQI